MAKSIQSKNSDIRQHWERPIFIVISPSKTEGGTDLAMEDGTNGTLNPS